MIRGVIIGLLVAIINEADVEYVNRWKNSLKRRVFNAFERIKISRAVDVTRKAVPSRNSATVKARSLKVSRLRTEINFPHLGLNGNDLL